MMEYENIYKLDNGIELTHLEVVRALPDKRVVLLGGLNGKNVYAKFYLSPRRGEIHWQRELYGLNAFKENDIATADIIYAGKTQDKGYPIILLDELADVVTVTQAWNEADTIKQEKILKRMVLLIAQHHEAGLTQTDMHLDNFLLSDQVVFSLDGAGVKTHEGGVSNDTRLQNLGLFIAQLAPEWESRVQELYDIYAEECGWDQGPGSQVLMRCVHDSRIERWKEFRSKLFRNCTAFTYAKDSSGYFVASNKYVSSNLLGLLKDPDATFNAEGKVLKNGNTSSVWVTNVDGRDLVIKRYNVKWFWQAVKVSIFPGRGVRSWVNGYRLLFYGIPTPAPVALLKRKTLLFTIAYCITEYINGVNARNWFRDSLHSMGDKGRMADAIVKILLQLRRQKISHGDLKASNILISSEGPLLTDLDAMISHKDSESFENAWKKDVRRFMQNWENDKDIYELFSNSLESAGVVDIEG
jgi:tRNA A-37 threonylcarbamoyl transferase component Bud32